MPRMLKLEKMKDTLNCIERSSSLPRLLTWSELTRNVRPSRVPKNNIPDCNALVFCILTSISKHYVSLCIKSRYLLDTIYLPIERLREAFQRKGMALEMNNDQPNKHEIHDKMQDIGVCNAVYCRIYCKAKEQYAV